MTCDLLCAIFIIHWVFHQSRQSFSILASPPISTYCIWLQSILILLYISLRQHYYHEIYRIRLNYWFLNTLGVTDPSIFSLVNVKNHFTPVNCIQCQLQYSLCLTFISILANSFGSLPNRILFTISFSTFAKEHYCYPYKTRSCTTASSIWPNFL
jgi:hypothetical protein